MNCRFYFIQPSVLVHAGQARLRSTLSTKPSAMTWVHHIKSSPCYFTQDMWARLNFLFRLTCAKLSANALAWINSSAYLLCLSDPRPYWLCWMQVRTELTGGLGDVDVEESAAGLFAVLTSGKPLNNRFYSFTGQEIPWWIILRLKLSSSGHVKK